MKQVEIRVRELARLAESDIGVPLMRKAFHPETGLLADPSQEGGERQATTDLFAGRSVFFSARRATEKFNSMIRPTPLKSSSSPTSSSGCSIVLNSDRTYAISAAAAAA